MMKLARPLPEVGTMKDARPLWLGHIPATWDVPPVYARFHVHLGKMLDEKRITGTRLAPYLRNVDVQWDRINVTDLPEMDFDDEDRAHLTLRAGDLLVCEGGEVGRTAMWSGQLEECYYQKALHRLRPTGAKDHPRFFAYVMRFAVDVGAFAAQATAATIEHLPAEKLRVFRYPAPPIAEQQRIAEFLDRETARLDELVAAKRRLLGLLVEKRRALITHAVTRGLDPAAQLRDSGHPWLGEIPTHWRAERTKWLLPERDERTDNDDGEMLTVSHLTGVTPRSQKDVNMFEAETTEGYKICRRGDLAINTLWAWMGAMGVAPCDGIVSPAYNVYVPSRDMEAGYVDALVRLPTFAQEVTRFSKGVWSSRLRLYPEGLYEVWLPVPPLAEQRAIVAHIATETAKLDALRGAAERTLALLRERRSALIAAAVTGKLRVPASAVVVKDAGR